MSRYKVSGNELNRSIRLIGAAYRKILPYSTDKTFMRENRILSKFIKGHWLSRRTVAETAWAKRSDGSGLRLLICRAKSNYKASERHTGLLWIHGGGYATGIPETDFTFADIFCQDGSCVAVLPDYIRSTESPYPAALDDCNLALCWMYEHSEELGIDKSQIFVGGDSAGGGLTAALCLYNRDHGSIPIAFQFPLYPMLDDREVTASSKDNDAPVWNTRSNREGWKLYLGSISGDEVPIYAAPSRTLNFSNLPPACTYVGDVEPFYDETLAFFDGLKKAGIPVFIREFKGCYHGFDMIAYMSKPAREARAFLYETFKYAQKTFFRETLKPLPDNSVVENAVQKE